MIKKVLLISILSASMVVQAAVQVKITSGIDNANLQAKMERTMSQLLTEINSAQAGNRSLNLGQ